MSSVALFLAGWALGSLVTMFILAFSYTSIDKSPGQSEQIPESLSLSLPVFFIEQEGKTLYLYDMTTATFMCQATSLDELALNLAAMHKDIEEAVVLNTEEDKMKSYIFKHGQATELDLFRA